MYVNAYVYICIYIWVNYNNSLTRNLQLSWGWFRWGRYMGVASGVGVPQVRWTGWFMEHPAQKWIFMRDSTILGNLHIWLYVYIMSYNLHIYILLYIYYYIYITIYISINTIYCYTIIFVLSMLAWQFEHLELDHRIYLYLSMTPRLKNTKLQLGHDFLERAWRPISASKNHKASPTLLPVECIFNFDHPKHLQIIIWRFLWIQTVKQISKSSRYFNPPWCFFPLLKPWPIGSRSQGEPSGHRAILLLC